MLSEITGRITRKIPGKIWLKTGPLVWEIMVPFTFTESLPPPGKEVRLPVCVFLRGEVPEIYGLPNETYRETFLLLSSLPRIGPRLALNLLALFSPRELEEAVRSEDISALSRVPGIGPRRAERLCLELRARLGLRRRPREHPPVYEEALAVLKSLGFSAEEAEEALEEVFTGKEDLEELLRRALKRFSPT